MSEETMLESQPPAHHRPSRMRRFFLRHVPLSIGALLVLVALLAVQLYFYASSARFQNVVRERLVVALSNLTGGRVEIASFQWRLLHLEAEADGIVIHGREAPGEAPYAQIARLRASLSIFGFLSPKIRLRDLEIEQPALHLIVYPDGSTNQPQPSRRKKPGQPIVDRLFDLQAGRVIVAQGTLDYENRAAKFDFQDRHIPLNFDARDVSLRMSYLPAAAGAAERYRIRAGASDLSLARGAGSKQEPAVHGRVEATLDLMRTEIRLAQLLLRAREPGGQQRALEISGTLQDFTNPRWQAKIAGDLDMRLLEPVTGYPFAPEGLARLDLTAGGGGRFGPGQFNIQGRVHVDGGAYIGTGVVARGVTLDAQVHADPYRLLIANIVARPSQGGAIEGTVDLTHWLPPVSGEPQLIAEPQKSAHPARRAEPAPLPSSAITLPVDGKVEAQLHNVSLDTLLGMVSPAPFQRLGFGVLLNGPAHALWTKGDDRTLTVTTMLALSPSNQGSRPNGASKPAEAPANGVVDATYTHRDGAVALRQLQLNLPGSSIAASGRLGAYPMTSATDLTLDFHSHNLEGFDTVLRSLHLQREGKAGAEALPAHLAGQADFHGTWTGSLLRPRIAGTAQATQLAIEMPHPGTTAPRFLAFDSVQAAGSYSDTKIAIGHAELQHGPARLTLSGTLDASPGPGNAHPAGFDGGSVLHLNVQATQLSIDDLRPFVSGTVPVTGLIGAQLAVEGPLSAPSGSGWIDLTGGSLWNEPLAHARAQGSLAGKLLKLSSIQIGAAGGSLTGSGSYDFDARQFRVNASGSGIELDQIAAVKSRHLGVSGRLALTAAGSGTLDSPHLDARATVSSLVAAGQHLGRLDITAQSSGDGLHYNMKTLLAGAELNLQGETEMRGEYLTQDRLEFTGFDVGALLKVANVQGISGQSALEGAITLAGPLKHPDQLRGEARLKTLAITLAGVHLTGEGGAHATLAAGRIHLDPVHVTGEDTDLHALGTLSLTGTRQMDLAASGSINLKLAETLDPDLTASGTTTFEVEAHGTMRNPGLRGRIDVQNGAMSLEDLPNGLSQLKGTLIFNQNRLEIRELTAMTGGGLLSVGGSLTYQHGLYADLSVTGKGVRIRYPQGVSSLADANLRLQGLTQNLLLSGNVLITRFATSPDLDLAALAEQASTKVDTVALPDAPSNHVRLDIHLLSSPQLNFQNAFAKLAGDVDLRIRGTVASPSVIGRISVTEGSAVIAGTRYELQRGEVTLTNPVRIEPTIDLTATAHVQDYDITLGLHGTLQKLSVTYRSDPPLPESDVVSLLALGHTQDQERLYTQQQEQVYASPTTDALLGGALNATVSSRVQKLFGAGSVKVDPNYLGAFGNSTSRITVQEQLGRNVVLTYATDVNTTGQQLLQADVAINRHISLVVARDEAGVFSMVLKATRRYR
jgi:translocation and assembly module TamB